MGECRVNCPCSAAPHQVRVQPGWTQRHISLVSPRSVVDICADADSNGAIPPRKVLHILKTHFSSQMRHYPASLLLEGRISIAFVDRTMATTYPSSPWLSHAAWKGLASPHKLWARRPDSNGWSHRRCSPSPAIISVNAPAAQACPCRGEHCH